MKTLYQEYRAFKINLKQHFVFVRGAVIPPNFQTPLTFNKKTNLYLAFKSLVLL